MSFFALCAQCGRDVRAASSGLTLIQQVQVPVYYLCYGSATLMLGKSLTCREASLSLAVCDRRIMPNRVGDPKKKKGSLPASQRLAAHRRGRAPALRPGDDAGTHSPRVLHRTPLSYRIVCA